MSEKDFDKNFNISYVDENLPSPDNELVLKHCFFTMLIYAFIYFLLLTNPFFQKYFNITMRTIYEVAIVAYAVFAPVLYLKFRPKTLYKSHSIEIFNYLKRLLKIDWKNSDYKIILDGFKPTYYEKQSIMLIFIKVFFGTLKKVTTFAIPNGNNGF